MSTVRAFLIGLLIASAVVVVFVFDHRHALVGLGLAIAALAVAAVFGPGTRGWPSRALRGGLGFVLAAAAGVAAVFYFKGEHDWFDWPADSAGELWLAILALHAAVPGAAAAAPPPPRGLALAAGFALGLGVPMMLTTPRGPGFAVLLAVGTVVGAAVGALGRDRRAR